jgi:hypothetical protein
VSGLSEVDESSFHRQHVGKVQFNRWPDDYILLTTVLKQTDDGCSFARPVKEDESHYIGPVQSAWVIHSRVKKSDSKEINGLFHKDDKLTLDDLPEGEAEPLSFRPLKSFHKKRLKVEDVSNSEDQGLRLKVSVETSLLEIDDGQQQLSTDGVVEAVIHAKPEYTERGCQLQTTYCVEGHSCENGAYESFSNLTVNLTSGLVPKVESVLIK